MVDANLESVLQLCCSRVAAVLQPCCGQQLLGPLIMQYLSENESLGLSLSLCASLSFDLPPPYLWTLVMDVL